MKGATEEPSTIEQLTYANTILASEKAELVIREMELRNQLAAAKKINNEALIEEHAQLLVRVNNSTAVITSLLQDRDKWQSQCTDLEQKLLAAEDKLAKYKLNAESAIRDLCSRLGLDYYNPK